MRAIFLALAVLFLTAGRAVPKPQPNDQTPKPLPSIAEKTSGMRAMPGFFNCYWDARTGKVWLEISRFDSEFLYVASLAAGVGSNDIGLDRGQFSGLDDSNN